jgi:hypothetical protein
MISPARQVEPLSATTATKEQLLGFLLGYDGQAQLARRAE